MSLDMFPDSFIDYMLEQEKQVEKCSNCGKEIQTMSFRGTGVCGDLCRKAVLGETDQVRAQTDAGITALLREPGGADPRTIT